MCRDNHRQGTAANHELALWSHYIRTLIRCPHSWEIRVHGWKSQRQSGAAQIQPDAKIV